MVFVPCAATHISGVIIAIVKSSDSDLAFFLVRNCRQHSGLADVSF